MKIITTNPIITGTEKTFDNDFIQNDSGFNGLTVRTTQSDPIMQGSLKSFRDDFIQNDSGFDGLTVITSDPILSQQEYFEDDWTSAASGATRRAKKSARQKTRGNKKAAGDSLGQKFGRGLGKLADSGIIDSLLNRRQGAGDIDPNYDPNLIIPPVDNSKKDEGMSIGAKVAIAVLILAVVGGGAYYLIKKKK